MRKTRVKQTNEETMRIQKWLSQRGVGSRRQIESWIEAGRIKVNGELAVLGQAVGDEDKIEIDGERLRLHRQGVEKKRVLIYHKPEGVICTRRDPQGRPCIFDHLPLLRQGRWVAVGRLDLNTSGLLILTNDGELAHRLMHPSYEVEREYAVRVLGEVTEPMLKQMKKGVDIEGERYAFDDIEDAGGTGANHWYKVILREGKNREVRRLWESQGVKVSRLIRTRFADLALPRMLRPGRWAELEPEAIKALSVLVGLSS